MSLVLDDLGIYYDPRTPSRLEYILQNHEFDAQLITRSSALVKTLVEKNITKYNLQAGGDELNLPDGRRVILVPGQVDNDASIRFGGNNMTAKGLLQAVRSAEPDSYIVFKPHPDVVSGLRPGLSDPQIARKYCDHFATDIGIERLIDACNEIHTISSLTGFEALMRGKKVSCYGMPFYAGWGLTTDSQKCPRRTRTLTLEQLVAATLIQYPRYFDPKSNLPCSPELVIKRIQEEQLNPIPETWLIKLRRRYGLLRQVLSERKIVD